MQVSATGRPNGIVVSSMYIIGHRGARGLAPENTLAAIQEGLAAGANEIEIDVRVTKDGVCVLNHDPFLHDASNGKLRSVHIAEHTLQELYAFRPALATLEEAIRLVNRRVPMVVELKPKVATNQTIANINTFLKKGWQPHDFLFASFSQRSLRQLHAALPAISIVVNERFGGIRGAWRARQLGAQRLAFNHHNLWWGFIRSMHRKGYKIAAYTLNDPLKARRWERHGLYAVVTDFPDRFTQR